MSSPLGRRWAPAAGASCCSCSSKCWCSRRRGDRRVLARAGVQRAVDHDRHADGGAREPAVLDGLQSVVGNGPVRRGSQRARRRDCGCCAGVSRDRTMAARGCLRVGQSGCGRWPGKTWTALLATQVALSLAILPSAIEMMWGIFRPRRNRRARTPCRGVSDGLAGDGRRHVPLRQPQDRSRETAEVRGRRFRCDGIGGGSWKNPRRISRWRGARGRMPRQWWWEHNSIRSTTSSSRSSARAFSPGALLMRATSGRGVRR